MDDKNNDNLKDNFMNNNEKEDENKTAKNLENQNNSESEFNKENKTNMNEGDLNNEEEKSNKNNNEKLENKEDIVNFNNNNDDNKNSNKSNELLQNKDQEQIKNDKDENILAKNNNLKEENNIPENNKEIKEDDLKKEEKKENIDEKNINNNDTNKMKQSEENINSEAKNNPSEKEESKGDNINSEENNIKSIENKKNEEENMINDNLIDDLDIKKEINVIDNDDIEETQKFFKQMENLNPADIFNQGAPHEDENENELAKKISENEEEIKKKEIEDEDREKVHNEESNIRKFFEKEEKERRIKKLEEYSKKIDNLLESIKNDWAFGDRNSFITTYEYKYINDMNELFNRMNDDQTIKDEVICKIFKFICDYFYSRKNLLYEIPWVEINNLRKILIKENFEGVCILQNFNLLDKQYEEILFCYDIDKTEENIMEYNNNNFFKYLIEFLFRCGFFESFIEKIYSRDDEIFFAQDENAIPGEYSSFFDDFINLIFYPFEAFSYCKREYLMKNNYCEKFIEKFIMKIESIIKCSALKEEFKKQFYTVLTEKYKIFIGNLFNNFDETKEKLNPIWEKFSCYVLIIAENYLNQQKLESRIFGLNLITQLTDVFKFENKSGEYANKLLFVKLSIIKYMNKINIYNLIFGENIHEALVHRAYNLLSFLYKNKAFNKEQIKHL